MEDPMSDNEPKIDEQAAAQPNAELPENALDEVVGGVAPMKTVVSEDIESYQPHWDVTKNKTA
jgi:hypothetical protein